MDDNYEIACPDCDGTGYEENPFGQLSGCGGANECSRCSGSGTIFMPDGD